MNTKSQIILTLLLVVLVTGSSIVLGFSEVPMFTSENKSNVSVLMGGDIYVGDRIIPLLENHSADYLVKHLKPVVENSELHLANLESPITTRNDTFTQKRYVFKTRPKPTLKILNSLSIDGVSLANNHVMDYGVNGLIDTARTLNHAGIKYAGVGADRKQARKYVLFEREGVRIAFIAFSNTYPKSFWAGDTTPGTAYGNSKDVSAAIEAANKRADHTVVSFHWGGEMRKKPKGYQEKLARGAINAGADVVFGHHPHTIQPVERFKDGLIFYSLGNYYFTTMSKQVQYGLLVEVIFNKDKRTHVKYHVININNPQVHYRPRLVKSFDNSSILGQFIGRPDLARYVTLSGGTE